MKGLLLRLGGRKSSETEFDIFLFFTELDLEGGLDLLFGASVCILKSFCEEKLESLGFSVRG